MVLLLVCRYVVLLQNENLHATEEKKRSCALATHKDRNSCPTEYKSNHTNQVDTNTTFAFSYKLYSTFGICFGNRIRKSEKEWERERDFTLFQVKRLQWWQYTIFWSSLHLHFYQFHVKHSTYLAWLCWCFHLYLNLYFSGKESTVWYWTMLSKNQGHFNISTFRQNDLSTWKTRHFIEEITKVCSVFRPKYKPQFFKELTEVGILTFRRDRGIFMHSIWFCG